MMTKTNITTAYKELEKLINSGKCYEVPVDGKIATCKLDSVRRIEYNDNQYKVVYECEGRVFCSTFDEFLTLTEAEKKSKIIKEEYKKRWGL